MAGTKTKNLLQILPFLVILNLAISLPIFNVSRAAAATPPAGQGLEISPPRFEIRADPGQVITTQVSLRNITKDTLTVSVSAEDFVAKDEKSCVPKLLLGEDEKSPYSLKDWVGQLPQFSLRPDEQKTLTVTISVPNDASPGGHYGDVRFTASTVGVRDSEVALSLSIGALILVRVSGDVKESAQIKEFFVERGGKRGTFFQGGPLTLVQRVEANGNSHIRPTGEVVVKNIFGKEVVKYKVNDPPCNVLPGSTRRFEQKFPLVEKVGKFDTKSTPNHPFGRYSATITLTYANNKKLTQTIKFWVIPWKLILLILLILIILFIVLRFGVKRYNKHVISKAQSSPPRGGRDAKD